MSTDWSYTNRERQMLVEVFSVHGSSDYIGCEDEVDGFNNGTCANIQNSIGIVGGQGFLT